MELDLNDRNVDVESGVLTCRTLRWLDVRVTSIILDRKSRLRSALTIR